LSSLVNNVVHKKFFRFGLGTFSPNINKVQILITFPHFRPPVIEKVEKSEQRFGRQSGAVYKFKERSVQLRIFRRQVALQVCRSYAGVETCTRRQLWTPLPPASKDVQSKNLQLH